MDMLRELYQEVVLDHGKNPRNKHALEDATHSAWGNNPMCGDKLAVYLHVEEDKISALSFQGEGCAISQASASLMTQVLKGLSLEDAKTLQDAFHALATGEDAAPQLPTHLQDAFERLEPLAGVRAFPMRVKCATLAWHTREAALSGEAEVSTE